MSDRTTDLLLADAASVTRRAFALASKMAERAARDEPGGGDYDPGYYNPALAAAFTTAIVQLYIDKLHEVQPSR